MILKKVLTIPLLLKLQNEDIILKPSVKAENLGVLKVRYIYLIIIFLLAKGGSLMIKIMF